MSIYPYVYRLDHPVTGEFYIGYRCANKVPAEEDLGHKYFTSSKSVKSRFSEFNYHIVAEFFDKSSAYDHEQLLIAESWSDDLLLNKSCYSGKKKFARTGEHTPESIEKQKKTKSSWSDSKKNRFSKTMSSIVKQYHDKLSDEDKQNRLSKISQVQLNRSPEEAREISEKISSTISEIMKNRTEEEWATIKNKKSSTWAMRAELGILRISPAKTPCPHCGKLISPSNLSRHIISKH